MPILVPDILDETSEKAIVEGLKGAYVAKPMNVWPAAYDAKERRHLDIDFEQMEFVLVPLDRLGAPSGMSGSRVIVGYYRHCPVSGAARIAISPPLVIKVGPAMQLREEHNRSEAWPTLPPQTALRFARPLWFGADLVSGHPDLAVLVAPFSSNIELSEDGLRHEMKVQDLWRLLIDPAELRGPDWPALGEIERHLRSVLEILDPVHRANYSKYQREPRSYRNEYDWYLRRASPSGSDKSNIHIPERLFGTGPTVERFGRVSPNPIRVVGALCIENFEFVGSMGAIHGDLHPKNIVLGKDIEYVIDFGWAHENSHLVKDFALLDLNIRAITLPAQTPDAEVVALANLIKPGDDVESLPPCVRHRARLIKNVIWDRVSKTNIVDWDREYLAPLFLISYGLLVYMDTARNQTSLMATVLRLADHLAHALPELRI